MSKIKLGIIGIGNMGTGHYNNIKNGNCPEVELVAVADTNPDRIKWAEENMAAQIKKFSTAEEMLDSGLINAALVAIPHYDHPKYAMACMERGIHVMVEKPAGVYTKQVREMNEFAKKSNVVFGMMFNQRTNHVYRKVKELIDSGRFGAIRRTNWIITDWYRSQTYYDSGDWRATWSGEGGGVLLNQCPHQLDLWQWICGMPVEVTAKLSYGQWRDIEVEDDVSAFVKYANGATGVFVTTTGDPCGTNRLEIQLEKGKIVTDGNSLDVYEVPLPEPEFSKNAKQPFDSQTATKVEVETDGKSLQHIEVLNRFAAAILRNEPLTADGSEGINGLTLSNAMHLSSWLNQTVTLPFDEDLFYEELMKRVKTSRRKTNVKNVTADTEGTYGGAK
ncbi:MAG: Gfo/Idh/MocA family oxidoreductase [Clostridia bacterium]|nr:Gfo/Idh/MocA family oxidoreductase [Clostridia bacterium]